MTTKSKGKSRSFDSDGKCAVFAQDDSSWVEVGILGLKKCSTSVMSWVRR